MKRTTAGIKEMINSWKEETAFNNIPSDCTNVYMPVLFDFISIFST